MEGEKLVQNTICSIWMGVDGGYPFMTGESDYGDVAYSPTIGIVKAQ